MPGGITVLRCAADGAIVPEFISDGFAAMTGMTLEQAYALYGSDAGAGVHPEDATTSWPASAGWWKRAWIPVKRFTGCARANRLYLGEKHFRPDSG